MKSGASTPQRNVGEDAASERRTSPRVTLLIRVARLVCASGEFVCVIRDVSETGVSVRLFHALPAGSDFELQMPGGLRYATRKIWARVDHAGFEFVKPIDVAEIINESMAFPKRGLRVSVQFPATMTTFGQRHTVLVENLSQQGARFECETRLAIDQNLRLEGPRFREVYAKVRWRRDDLYGVVFDDTLTLGEFARLAALLQDPALLRAR